MTNSEEDSFDASRRAQQSVPQPGDGENAHETLQDNSAIDTDAVTLAALGSGNVTQVTDADNATQLMGTVITERIEGADVFAGSSDIRYQIGDELARGGMGAVYDSRDVNLRRDVAMKVMLGARADEGQLRRFIEEAQITGQLEHPSIVPVHELGKDQEGALFYTMKKVNGETLKEILDGLYAGDLRFSEDYNLAKLLDIFTRVCDAVAFAHSKGVVHRDLKPENIMVGDYGEVQVMDWGLAKVIAEDRMDLSDEHDSSFRLQGVETDSISTIREDNPTDHTLEGQIMGTPRYMAPEQARGDISQIGPWTDVYALGAILYQTLTLRPPVDGQNVRELLDRVMKGEITPPSDFTDSGDKTRAAKNIQDETNRLHQERRVQLDHCPNNVIPNSLSAVCMKALQTKHKDRYGSVAGLKDDVHSYIHGFATQAEDASLAKQILLLMKRNKKVVGIAMSALLLLMLITGAAFYVVKQSEATAHAARDLAELNAKEAREQTAAADKSRLAEERQSEIAEQERLRAEVVSDFLSEMLSRANPLLGSGKSVTVLDVIDEMSSEIKEKFSDDELIRSRLDTVIARVYGGLGKYEKAAAHYKSAMLVFESVRTADRGRYFKALTGLANVDFRLARYAEAETSYLEVIEYYEEREEEHLELASVYKDLGALYATRGEYAKAEPFYLRGIEICESSDVRDGRVFAGLLQSYALLKQLLGKLDDAEGLYEKAIPLFIKSRGEMHPDVADCYNNLGTINDIQKDVLKARSYYDKALKIREETLGKRHAAYGRTLFNIGILSFNAGDLEAAEKSFTTVVGIFGEQLGSKHPSYANAIHTLGVILSARGRHDEALVQMELGLSLRKKALGVKHPQYGLSIGGLASVHDRLGDYEKSQRMYLQALEIFKSSIGENHHYYKATYEKMEESRQINAGKSD